MVMKLLLVGTILAAGAFAQADCRGEIASLTKQLKAEKEHSAKLMEVAVDVQVELTETKKAYDILWGASRLVLEPKSQYCPPNQYAGPYGCQDTPALQMREWQGRINVIEQQIAALKADLEAAKAWGILSTATERIRKAAQ